MLLKSYAKANYFLRIINYDQNAKLHRLISGLVLIEDIFDLIEIEERQGNDEIIFNTSEIDKNNNTVKNSLQLCRLHFKKLPFFKISIAKNIPLMSGLGGGSSNAGTILKFLFNKYNFSIPSIEIVKNIGSDVNFFIHFYKAAIIYGFGEIVVPMIKLKEMKEVIKTDLKISTSKAFSQFKQEKIIYSNWKMPFNDLQNSAISIEPKLSNYLLSNKQETSLSGSGGTIIEWED